MLVELLWKMNWNVNTTKRRSSRRILKHLAFSWNLVWTLFIPFNFIWLISLLEAGQMLFVKDIIRNFLIYVNKKNNEVWKAGQNNLKHNTQFFIILFNETKSCSFILRTWQTSSKLYWLQHYQHQTWVVAFFRKKNEYNRPKLRSSYEK